MMTTKTLLIYFVISIIVFAFAITPKSETEYLNNLNIQFQLSNQITTKTNQAILAAIKAQVEAYPQYELYLENAIAIDSISHHILHTKSNNISTIQRQFHDLIDINKYDKKYIEDITESFIDYNNLPNNSTSERLQNTLNETALSVNTMVCLNFLASRTQGSHSGCWFGFSEPIMINNQTLLEQGKSHTFQLALGSSYDRRQQKTNKISVNEIVLPLRDSKARFKVKATKSGWNEMNILVDATFLGKAVQKEKTFRYYVK